MTDSTTTFAVPAVAAFPDLAGVTPAGASWEVSGGSTESHHLDTADHDLLRAGVSLARIVAGDGRGWRLELPDGDVRTVADRLRTPAGDDVPAELAAATVGVRRGRDLHPLATVKVHRTAHRLVGTDGTEGTDAVSVADETVHTAAATPDGALLEEFRRWVVTGSGEVAEAVRARLAAVDGVTEDTEPGGDVARALVGHPAVVPARKRGKKDRRTAGEVILAYLRAQDDALVAGDLLLRSGTGGIHPTRVATRRLRSTLRIFRPFVDADRAAAFDAELSWYAATLGEVRDREVQRVRMRALVDEIPDELVLGPVGGSIDAALRSEEILHRERLAEALDSERYLALLREAHLWSTTPPFTERAAKKASALTKRVDRAAAKLLTHLEAGLSAGGDDEELHSARKAGKRARYAAELATPVLGRKAATLVSRYEEVQDVLGDFQDGVVACALIRRLAAGTVGKRKENGFTYGLLYAREQQRAVVAKERAFELFSALRG